MRASEFVSEISDQQLQRYLDRAGRQVDARQERMARVRDRLNRGYEIYHADTPNKIVDRFEARTAQEAQRYYADYIANYESDRDYDLRLRRATGIMESTSNTMSTEDMIAYLRQHHDTNLHQDYLDHVNTFLKFVLKDIPLASIRTELSGLDPAKVEKYKQMDFSKAPPIVLGDGYILDGYHRATVAKALGIPSIRAYVGVKGVAEGYARKLNFDEIYGKYLKVTDNSGDPGKPGFSLVTPLNGDSWNWRERPEFIPLVKKKLNQPGWLGNHKYQQIIDAMAGKEFDPAKHIATEDTEDYAGMQIRVSKDSDGVAVRALAGGRELGMAEFFFDDEGRLDPQTVWVDERYHGQGIAAAMYDYLKDKGYTIVRSWDQTDAGRGFWDKHRGEEATVWENQIDEIRGPNVAYQHLVPDIVADFQKGMSITDLQKKYSIAGPTIKNAIRRVIGDQEFQRIMDYRYGKGTGQKRNTSADVIAKMAQEYAQGSSMDEIAQHFSISPASVQRYLSALPNRNELHRSFLIARNKFEDVNENFADGKKPGRKGLSKRVGIPKKATLSQLEKIARSSTGEKRRMAQWQLNMRRGKAKKAK